MAVMCAATTGKWRGLVWDKLLQLLHILTPEVLQDWRVVFFVVVISAKAKKGDSSVRPVELFMVSVVKRDLDCT